MTDTRLIERWLPIAEIGEESTRERRSMTALPPTYYLHVWWARRPLARIMREGVYSGRDTRASVWYKRSVYKRLGH